MAVSEKYPAQLRTAQLVESNKTDILDGWIDDLTNNRSVRADLLEIEQLRRQSREMLNQFAVAISRGDLSGSSPEFQPIRTLMSELSITFAKRGFSPSETANYVFSLKHTLVRFLQREYAKEAEILNTELVAVDHLIDQLGLLTFETYARTREQVIQRQQDELAELSVSVIQMWDGVLVLPIVGTLDSTRALLLTERLLEGIARTNSAFTVIDITGVPAVDTATAQHLMKTVRAVKLMGADCVISGIRPAIATTMVNLGVELSDIVTKFSLAEALRHCFRELGLRVVPVDARH